MACMEHECFKCKRVWFDNRIWRACPKCGSERVTNHFDEVPDE